jgi:hypothetical protein
MSVSDRRLLQEGLAGLGFSRRRFAELQYPRFYIGFKLTVEPAVDSHADRRVNANPQEHKPSPPQRRHVCKLRQSVRTRFNADTRRFGLVARAASHSEVTTAPKVAAPVNQTPTTSSSRSQLTWEQTGLPRRQRRRTRPRAGVSRRVESARTQLAPTGRRLEKEKENFSSILQQIRVELARASRRHRLLAD